MLLVLDRDNVPGPKSVSSSLNLSSLLLSTIAPSATPVLGIPKFLAKPTDDRFGDTLSVQLAILAYPSRATSRPSKSVRSIDRNSWLSND